jgi:hypothetical protein
MSSRESVWENETCELKNKLYIRIILQIEIRKEKTA